MTTLINKLNKTNLGKNIVKDLENNKYYNLEDFSKDVKRYVTAIKEQRVICSIASVSKSGMSRNLRFIEFGTQTVEDYQTKKKVKRGYQSTFYSLFQTLGYQEAKNDRGYFRVTGCGMDMIFHTNYTIIHDLCNLGFIKRELADKLAQKTPNYI